jgi:ABC-type bacteriocin/lantibiotic exporter with double-glycine peptidase domain
MKVRANLALLALFAAGAVCVCAAQAQATWIDVPFVAQSRDGCGSASISMVMQYWNKKEGQPSPPSADSRKIQAALFSPAARGIPDSSMLAYFRQSGYRVYAFDGQWSDLIHHLQLGRPLIVGLQASGPLGPLHYAVVVGIDPARGFLFLNDPAQRKMLRVSRQGFESEWNHTHNWTLLAVPQPRD